MSTLRWLEEEGDAQKSTVLSDTRYYHSNHRGAGTLFSLPHIVFLTDFLGYKSSLSRKRTCETLGILDYKVNNDITNRPYV